MKNYNELTNDLLERRDRYVADRKRRRKTVISVATTSFCFCLVVLLGFGTWQEEWHGGEGVDFNPSTTLENSTIIGGKDYINLDPGKLTSTQGVNKETSKLLLLCATMNGNSQDILEQNIQVPFNTEIRIRNIAGMSKEQVLEVIKEEDAYAAQMNAKYPAEMNYGRIRRENVLISTVNTGRFILNFENIDTIKKVEISVSETGVLIAIPKATGCMCTADSSQHIETRIELNKEGVQEICSKSESGGVELYWQISGKLADIINENPTANLSDFRDTITFTVEYSDGRTEVAFVDMSFDKNGQVYATLKETVITT